jgi:peptide/nickel transport system substrate-binding protein
MPKKIVKDRAQSAPIGGLPKRNLFEKSFIIFLSLAALVLVGISFCYFLTFKKDAQNCPVCSINNKNNQAKIGPASDGITFKVVKEEDAKQALLNGDIDIYADSLPSQDIEELKNNSAVKLFPATSIIMGLEINPYPGSTDQLNPFSIKQVRYALQFLINREDIANNLFSGFAEPTVTALWPEHPYYKNIKDSVDKMGIHYDKEKALSLIKTAMEESGATMKDGVWMYKNKPVNIIIPHSDWYKSPEIANLLKTSLEEAGFSVTLVYTDSNDPEAKSPVRTDASEMKWNISLTAYIFYNQSIMASIFIPSPSVRSGWWEYSNEDIKKLEEKLDNSQTAEDRKEIASDLTEQYLEDSTGIWLLVIDSVSAARSEVRGLVDDKFVGIKNFTNLREAYIPGKDKLIVGFPEIYNTQDSWNNLVVNDINMMYLLNTVHDPAKWSETDSLEEVGFRWPFVIDNQGPEENIEIPSDVFFWDAKNKKWQTVAENRKAVTKVTYDLSNYLDTNWHDGETINKADVVYNIARAWDAALDVKKQKLDDTWEPKFFKNIIGLRFVDKTLEIYLDNWSIDKSDLLSITKLFQRVAPWEIYAATDDLVFNQKIYNYQPMENSENKDLNLVNADHIAAIFRTLEKIKFSEVAPMMTLGDKIYAQESDLNSRLASLKHWYAEHNHLYISDGPFYVDSFNLTDGYIELKAFRDSKYPFHSGYWRQ